MAGRSAANTQEQHDNSSNRESSFLDHIPRRLESSSNEHEGTAAASPSSISMEALEASVLSPNTSANPWQYLSSTTFDPSSPTLQRDFYNLTHGAENNNNNPWMELEQQRVPPLFQPHSGATLLQRRREQQMNPANDWGREVVPTAHGPGLQSDAMLYEELAAAWYRNGPLRAASASPRSEGFQGMWEGLLQAYVAEENFARWGHQQQQQQQQQQHADNNSAAASAPLYGGRMGDASDEAAARSSQWQPGSIPKRELDHGTSSQTNSEAADVVVDTGTKIVLPGVVDGGGNASRSTGEFAGSPSASLSSGSGGDDSEDEECVARHNVDPPSVLDSCGKRKTPATSGELDGERDDSARTSEITDLKKPAPSEISNRPRKKKNTKRSREPRYAIKTRTDVDIMDDGFKWRKYGQKAVKNSPHPRNYYRCTTPQCPVRKRVERASEDSGMVITTYEGTHTHHTPGLIHRPAPERPLGGLPHPGSNNNNNNNNNMPPGMLGLGFRSSSLLPLPPEFTTLAALHQMRSLQQILAQQQIQMPMPLPLPGSLQRESLLRAQQFLGLHDPDVKPEPFHNFEGENHNHNHNHFMARRGFSYPGFQTPPIMRPQQQRPQPDPQIDGDLVRRVLEAEERELASNNNVDIPVENVESSRACTPPGDFVSQIQSSLRSRVEQERRRAALAAAAPPPRSSGPMLSRSRGEGEGLVRRHHAPSPSEDELVDGLLQEMAKRGESSHSSVSR